MKLAHEQLSRVLSLHAIGKLRYMFRGDDCGCVAEAAGAVLSLPTPKDGQKLYDKWWMVSELSADRNEFGVEADDYPVPNGDVDGMLRYLEDHGLA